MKHNDVILRHGDITVSLVIIIRAYTFLCKSGGHSVCGFKVTGGGGGRKKPGLNRVNKQK